MIAPRESWPLTTNLEFQTTERAGSGIAPLPSSGRVNLSIVTVGPHIPTPPRYADIADVVARTEKSPRRKAALVRARIKLAGTAYKATDQSIASIRLKKGWSQHDLSVAMGTSQPHIARIEAGDDVRISTVLNLAAALKIAPLGAFAAITNKMRRGK
jgi:ribosome-binding protein aMBF1 (putative translation factor)